MTFLPTVLGVCTDRDSILARDPDDLPDETVLCYSPDTYKCYKPYSDHLFQCLGSSQESRNKEKAIIELFDTNL